MESTQPAFKPVEVLVSVCLKYDMDDTNDEACRVIDALGGTGAVAKLCDVNPAAVSQWRRDGIPKARLQYLRLARPDVFEARAA